MEFNEDLGQFTCEYEGLIFAWDEDPNEDVQGVIKMLAENYFSHLAEIIEFMMPDIVDCYGDVSGEGVKNNLGRPIIDYNNGRVSYTEQTFDNNHIFEFEFLDDEFIDLQYFSIDG